MTRVLAIVTSNTEGGFWLSELTHPYWALTEAGFEVAIASPRGPGAVWNPWSDPRGEQSVERGDLVSLGFLTWPAAVDKLNEATPLADVDPDGFDGFWIAGGTGPVFDLRADAEVARLVTAWWGRGVPVAAICHGVIALPAVQVDGHSLVKGREVTGYSLAEDRELEQYVNGGRPMLPAYPQTELEVAGGHYTCAPPHQRHVVTSADGRLLTAQNQESATAFGHALAELLRQ